MTWKSYAAVSGATVLAGWLASSPSLAPTGSPVPVVRQSPVAASLSSDIVAQADRLQAGIQRERAYARPERNPFRFNASRSGAVAREPAPVPDNLPPVPQPVLPAGPRMSLSGIAEDQVDGRPVRTAILSTPADVLLVKEGEEILGRYRVARIGSDAVELLSLEDGATLRLLLR
jgi:hypothetical protein